eukprot:2614381-Amphidinium_carterae.1
MHCDRRNRTGEAVILFPQSTVDEAGVSGDTSSLQLLRPCTFLGFPSPTQRNTFMAYPEEHLFSNRSLSTFPAGG